MSMNIRWEPVVLKEPHPVSARELEQLERDWGVKLPEEYKQLVALYQGMGPEPSSFHVGGGESTLKALLTISEYEGIESFSVRESHEVIRPYVPAGIFPFGRTSGGEDVCFDYRDSLEQPGVVLVTVEMSVYPVSPGFRDFLKGLHE